MTAVARFLGTLPPDQINSAQKNISNPATAGHMANASGYGRAVGNWRPFVRRPKIHSAHIKIVRNGLTSAHKSPMSAQTNAIPTHQTTQTITGARLRKGSGSPTNPASTVAIRKITATARTIASGTRCARQRKRLTFSKLNRE